MDFQTRRLRIRCKLPVFDIFHQSCDYDDMGVSKNRGTPKSSILIGFSIINHPFWGTSIFGNTHMFIFKGALCFLFFLRKFLLHFFLTPGKTAINRATSFCRPEVVSNGGHGKAQTIWPSLRSKQKGHPGYLGSTSGFTFCVGFFLVRKVSIIPQSYTFSCSVCFGEKENWGNIVTNLP